MESELQPGDQLSKLPWPNGSHRRQSCPVFLQEAQITASTSDPRLWPTAAPKELPRIGTRSPAARAPPTSLQALLPGSKGGFATQAAKAGLLSSCPRPRAASQALPATSLQLGQVLTLTLPVAQLLTGHQRRLAEDGIRHPSRA